MNIIQYRKYCVNINNWDYIKLKLKLYNNSIHLIYTKYIKSGLGFWLNINTIILGYKLKDNHLITRPIYDSYRNKKIIKLNNDIIKAVIKRNKKLSYIELLKLKNIPLEIINYIFSITY